MLDSQLDLLQQHFIVEKGLARNTLAAYMSDLQHFGTFVRTRGASMFQELSREDIIAYLAERRQQGMAARTLARELVSLKTLYRFLHRQQAGTVDPTAQIRPHGKGATSLTSSPGMKWSSSCKRPIPRRRSGNAMRPCWRCCTPQVYVPVS